MKSITGIFMVIAMDLEVTFNNIVVFTVFGLVREPEKSLVLY